MQASLICLVGFEPTIFPSTRRRLPIEPHLVLGIDCRATAVVQICHTLTFIPGMLHVNGSLATIRVTIVLSCFDQHQVCASLGQQLIFGRIQYVPTAMVGTMSTLNVENIL